MSHAPGESPSMRAVVVRAPGGSEQLDLARVPAPELVAGTLEIEVKACALNRADLLQRRGAYPPPKGASEILGLECAGIVRALGAGVTGIELGSRVMALLAGGGYAERVVVDPGLVLSIPKGFSFVQAAAIPEAFLTASEALFTLGALAEGQVALIHAGASGVGTAAVQLAKLVGARVIACASTPEKLAFLRALGADVVVNHRLEDFARVCQEQTEGRGADVILDFVGGAYAERHQTCLAEAGRWIVLGLLGGAQAQLNLAAVLRRRWQVLGLVMRSRALADKCALVERFRSRLLPEFAQGRLEPKIDRVYPWTEVRAAHERMEQNLNQGKIVLEVG
ncbi:MAG: NAD(P)H-quinone oxidoreductase [Deltaproteobacteria bacterium]